jgi:hypothetical protein
LQGINNTVRVKIVDKFGDAREDDINIKLVTISLEKTKPTLLPALTSNLAFGCKLSGGTGSDVSNKKIIYTFYREENPTKKVLTLEQELNINAVDNIPSSLDLSTLDQGIYILTV